MKKKGNALAIMQKLGGSMMLPISMLPAAGLLLGLGYGLQNAQLLALFPGMAQGFPHALSQLLIAVSGAIFNNLPAIFAVGVAVGLSDDGACGLAGLVSLFTMNLTINFVLNITPEAAAANSVMYTSVMGVNTLQTGVFGGILCGILAYFMYVKFKDAKIPQYLGFFGGKRLIPIVSTVGAIFLGLIMSFIWPLIQNGIFDIASRFLSSDNPSLFAVFLYAFSFKLLGIVGLHHLIYPIYYYQLGTYTALDGTTVVGDWNIYFQQLADGVPVTAGACMSGSFVIYMLGLLGAGLAIYRCAKPENKKKTAGLMVAACLASSITGITEPLEYSFAFTALPLYLVHAVLTGLGYMICPALGIHAGTSFSGGLIDYILCTVLPGAPRWWLIIPVGLVFAVIYYLVFTFMIRKLNYKTPGREEEDEQVAVDMDAVENQLPLELIKAFGGAENFASLGACFTRLRVTVKDASLVDEARFKELGAKNVLHVGDSIQVVYGTQASQIKDQMKVIIGEI
ncbi:PTS transporter subunit EIIC [Laedolimicola sp.]|uniref:PTS transporter subunit EIIC n=1 Tax=Laedolimicola sp. TaxID=2981663 RepID=UPI003F7F2EB4